MLSHYLNWAIKSASYEQNTIKEQTMLVMKFGGTSVADAAAITRVVKLVKARADRKTVIVVSAISEATNFLTEVATLAAKNKEEQYKKILIPFKKRHLKITQDLIHNPDILKQTQNQIKSYFTELNLALENISSIAELSSQNFAKIVAYGELLSSTILHAALLEQKIQNTLVDARKIIITDDNYSKGIPLIDEMYKVMPRLFNQYLDQGSMVLTQGFIAGTKDGVTTILGREGSDYSASLIGMVMGAGEIQIWTDVDGIMTADPKNIAHTKFIPTLSFEEASELSYFGAKVIHPLTIQPAAEKNIPVRILNSMNLDPKQKGTLITHDTKTTLTKIRAITYKENIKIINISPKQISTPQELLSKTLALFASQKIAVDAAAASGINLALAINPQEPLDKVMDKLASFAKITTEEDKGLVAIIGKDFNNLELITKNIYQILESFNLRMVVPGPSNGSIILIVNQNEALAVTQKLHDDFFA